MSFDRFTANEGAAPGYARCARQPRDIYAPKLYVGKQRAPRLPDEAGSIAVVDLVFGDRVVVFAIPGDNDFRRVLLLRDSPHAAGAQAGNAQPKAQGGPR